MWSTMKKLFLLICCGSQGRALDWQSRGQSARTEKIIFHFAIVFKFIFTDIILALVLNPWVKYVYHSQITFRRVQYDSLTCCIKVDGIVFWSFKHIPPMTERTVTYTHFYMNKRCMYFLLLIAYNIQFLLLSLIYCKKRYIKGTCCITNFFSRHTYLSKLIAS